MLKELLSYIYPASTIDMIETHKHMSGIYAIDAEYIKPNTPFTRGPSFKLKKERSMINIRQKY